MATMKSILNGITPPYATRVARKLLNTFSPRRADATELLFDGDDLVFKQLAMKSKVYFEYGCGKSTIWCSFNIKGGIYSVDTSNEWVQDTKSKSCPNNIPHLSLVDCGAIGEWGRPTSYLLRDNFKEYVIGPFKLTSNSPDLILIDGRFRVACFLNSLSRSKPGTRIIFDDYTERPQYHVVEEFCPKPSLCGRQAIFTVPQGINHDLIHQEIERFTNVMD